MSIDDDIGAVIGVVRQVGCVMQHSSPFFQGKFGHVYEYPREFETPIPAKGQLGLWYWTEPMAWKYPDA